jgi:sRNA-binding carbon storage regulator CsrA
MGLMLERRQGQSVVIGGEIEVTVTQFGGLRVELDIKAPAQFGGHQQWKGARGESIQLGKDVRITFAHKTPAGVTDVKLIVDAPSNMRISRKD